MISAKQQKTQQAQAFAVKTLERLEELQMPSTPEFFELWYRYFEGHPDIVRAINTHEGKVDETVCEIIHSRYLSIQAQEGPIRKVNDQVQNSITTLVTKLKTATAATVEYGDSLTGAAEKISGATTLDDLGYVVTLMIDDTKKVMEKNKELESELVNSAQQVEDLKKYLDTVKKEASTDGLTGIANRKAFDGALVTALTEAHAQQTPLTLMMLDIDHFKKFNDTYGHPMGDQVLRLVARVLVGNVKGQDTAARYGGEEFVVILPGTPLAAGEKVAETLRRAIEARELVNKADNKKLGAITISIGVAECLVGEDGASLLERADAALYQAKHTGRNKVCVSG